MSISDINSLLDGDSNQNGLGLDCNWNKELGIPQEIHFSATRNRNLFLLNYEFDFGAFFLHHLYDLYLRIRNEILRSMHTLEDNLHNGEILLSLLFPEHAFSKEDISLFDEDIVHGFFSLSSLGLLHHISSEQFASTFYKYWHDAFVSRDTNSHLSKENDNVNIRPILSPKVYTVITFI